MDQPVECGQASLGRDLAEGRPNWTPILLAGAIFSGLSLAAAITSQGFLEADACTHYMFARFALREPHYLVSVWGRPVVTTLYAVPAALFGVVGVRATSLVLALLSAAITYRVARGQGYRHPELAVICLLAQPLFFLHSFSELTELPFATLLILAFWAYQSRQWLLMTVLLALGPATRPEGFGFLFLAAAALALHKPWRWLPILPLPLLVWTWGGWMLNGRPDYGHPVWNWLLWLPHNWPYSSTSMYQPGPLLFWSHRADGTMASSFLLRLPVVVSPLFFPFLLLGIWRTLRCSAIVCGSMWGGRGGLPAEIPPGTLSCRAAIFPQTPARQEPRPPHIDPSDGPRYLDHGQRCQLLIAILPLLILAGHSLLWWLGKMASNGELRYLLVVSPFWALLAARGIEWAFARTGLRGMFIWVGLAALLPVAVHATYPVIPLKLFEDDQLARRVAQWYMGDARLRREYPRLAASYISVYMFLDISTSDRQRAQYWGQDTVARTPRGTLLVWDPIYGQHNSDSRLCVSKQQILQAGWVPCKQFTQGDRTWDVFLSPQTDQGTATKPVKR